MDLGQLLILEVPGVESFEIKATSGPLEQNAVLQEVGGINDL